MILSRAPLARFLTLLLAVTAAVSLLTALAAGIRAGRACAGNPRRGRAGSCTTLAAMSTDSRPAAAPAFPARALASPMPLKPSLEGIEDTWSRRWEETGVVQV
jgi:hypothetical protein